MKVIMRSATILFLLGVISACSNQEKTTEQILEDDTKREEIMNMISEDPDMMMEMKGHMKASKGDMMMGDDMMMDTKKMGEMMGMIMDKMANDSTVCMEMYGMMMKDDHMKDLMMETCPKDGKEMMKEKSHIEMHRESKMN